jgi:NAD-dependent DNA ligase
MHTPRNTIRPSLKEVALMGNLEHDSEGLGRIHRRNNDKKYFCHLTGFLEGVAASGYLEVAEIEPLVAECEEFVRRVSDGDANDIVQDFEAELLEFETIAAAAENRIHGIDSLCEKSSTNRFFGFCRGVVCDGKIGTKEASAIVERISQNPKLMEIIGVRQIFVTCLDALADGVVISGESLEICKAISEVVGDSYGDTGIAGSFGVAAFEEFKLSNLEEDLIGKIVVLTGNFRTSPRSILEQKLMEFGAEIAKHVSSNTSFIVIGGEASRDWIEMNRGTKIRKAQQLRKSSLQPSFVSESQLLRLLG